MTLWLCVQVGIVDLTPTLQLFIVPNIPEIVNAGIIPHTKRTPPITHWRVFPVILFSVCPRADMLFGIRAPRTKARR